MRVPQSPRLIPNMLDALALTPSAYSIPTLVMSLALLLLGTLVLVRERVSLVSISFLALSLAVATWLFAFSFVYSAQDAATALWWAKGAYLGVPFIAPAAFQFTAAALHKLRGYTRAIVLSWSCAALFSIVATTTDTLITGVERYWWGYYPRYEWLGTVFMAFFFTVLIASMACFVVEYRRANPGTHKHRIRLFMVAFGIGYLGCVDFVAAYGVPLYPFGYVPLSGFLIVVAWTVWRHHLVDITPAFAAREIIATMRDALLVLDPDGIVRVANRAAVEMFGRRSHELIGQPVTAALGDPLFARQLAAISSTGTVTTDAGYELTYRPRQGNEKTISLSVEVMRGKRDVPVAMVCIAHDVTQRKRAEEEVRRLNRDLEKRVAERTTELQRLNDQLAAEVIERKRAHDALHQLAVVDELTGLHNRREMNRLLDDEMHRFQRYGRPTALILLDIDHFKAVNDTYGHQTGDEVLKWIAHLLRANVRATDRPARYGGEELAIIMPETLAKDAFKVAEDLRNTIAAQPFVSVASTGRVLQISVTVSLGVAGYSAAITTREDLIAAADDALYRAKRTGRNRTAAHTAPLLPQQSVWHLGTVD
ncbi:MAG TPA: diguanylate cyclase [Chloroflexia bacterium]|nr:diguanylate cyclase [Chloroflexia bacterium]